MLSFYKKQLESKGGICLRFKVRSNAGQTVVRDVLKNKTIKVDIAAPAEKGKANAELVKFLANEFKVDRKNVKIISGKGNALKLIKVSYKFY